MLLRLNTRGNLHLPISPLKSLLFSPTPASLVTSRPFHAKPASISPKPLLAPIAFSTSTSPTPTASSSSQPPMAPTTTVEHVVLFKVKEGTDPSKIDNMISNLRSLTSLDVVSHLAAVPILRNRSSAFHFTHLLHSRYKTKPDLAAYSAHPAHQAVVKDFVLPIADDIMAVDWVADLESGPVVLKPGTAARLTLAKLKEEEGKEGIMAVLGGIKNSFPGIEQVSYGENFSPARAKGFTIAFISVFPGLEELDALDTKGEMLEVQKEKVRPLLESVIVVDFVVPSPPSASLL